MAKRPGKKAVRKPVKKPVKKASKPAKRAAPKPAAKSKKPKVVTLVLPRKITLDLPPVLHDRLKALADVMDLTMQAVVRQALMEFAETWEDHHRTVAALAEDNDRVQVVVRD